MSRSGDIIDAAIREGKFDESRRAHYMELMAKNPKKTARLIAKLEGGLFDHLKADDEEERQAVQQAFGGGEGQAAPAASTGSGPTGGPSYPKDWLTLPGSGAASPQGGPFVTPTPGRSPITIENPAVAAQCMPGANVPEGLG